MAINPDLELVDESDLIDELHRRYDLCVVSCLRNINSEYEAARHWRRGGMTASIGLCRTAEAYFMQEYLEPTKRQENEEG